MDENLDILLTAVAASQKMDRSQLSAQLIYDGLQRFNLGKVLSHHLKVTNPTKPSNESVTVEQIGNEAAA